MNLSFFNAQKSRIGLDFERIHVKIDVLMADKVFYDSIVGLLIHNYWSIYNYVDEAVINSFGKTLKLNEAMQVEYDNMIELFPLIKQIKRQKHKSRDDLVLMGQYKSLLESCRNSLLLNRQIKLQKHDLYEIAHFNKEGVLSVEVMDLRVKENTEHPHIKAISNIILHRESYFSVHEEIYKIFKCTTIDDDENDAEIIKISLWNIPPLMHLTFDQMKYCRRDIKHSLDHFKVQLADLNKRLSGIKFNSENMIQIKQLCREFLLPHKAPVANSINESIYLSKLRNSFPEGFNLIFTVCVTSAAKLIDFYVEAKVLEPYMANEIKQQVSKYIDLSTSIIVTFNEQFAPENINEYFERIKENKMH